MKDLNVTEGEWVVSYNDWNGKFDVQSKVKEGGLSTDVSTGLTRENAYLFAQAKNMYEMLKTAADILDGTNFKDEVSNEDIRKLLNACKPPENKNERMDKC